MYALLFRLVLSRMDPETAHHLAFRVIRMLPGFLRGFSRPHPSLAVDALGVRFPSPFGLAAGFDKEAAGIRGLGVLGFGHVEVGTITAVPQPGNPRPRLFRLVPDRAVINRMGFNNAGAEAAARRLETARRRRHRPVIGVNIGKSRVVAVEDALEDYLDSTRRLAPSPTISSSTSARRTLRGSAACKNSTDSRRCSKPSVTPRARRPCSSKSPPTSPTSRRCASRS